MTPAEFSAYRDRAIEGYAAAHVSAGNWSPEEAQDLAVRETDDILPDGVGTAGMLLLVAETAGDGVVGMVWGSLEDKGHQGAWGLRHRRHP